MSNPLLYTSDEQPTSLLLKANFSSALFSVNDSEMNLGMESESHSVNLIFESLTRKKTYGLTSDLVLLIQIFLVSLVVITKVT